jgi:hypothetical protein
MPADKHDKQLGKERLERIIEMCLAIENHQADPFSLNVDDIIGIVKMYFPQWNQPEELKLDAEALHHLASVIKLQSEWLSSAQPASILTLSFWRRRFARPAKWAWFEVFASAWNPSWTPRNSPSPP